MDFFHYRNGELYCEDVPAQALAERFGTPLYVYSQATLLHHYHQLADAFKPLDATICYSIKSLGNLHICKLLAQRGCGFDVTSGGELYRALKAGAEAKKIIFAGVGKSDDEIKAGLEAGIAAFNIESEEELENIDRIAGSVGKNAIGALRVNPDVDPQTHIKTATGKKETKFGVDIDRAEQVFDHYNRQLRNVRLAGIHIHIGSPILEIEPYVLAVQKVIELIDRLTMKGHLIEWFDVGGGFGVNYRSPDQARPVTEHAQALLPLLKGKPYRIAFEPGRYISGNSGIVLTRVLYRKKGGSKQFVITDVGMNDLIRPTLYEGYHYIWPTHVPTNRREDFTTPDSEVVDIVGPVCESGDFMAKDRTIPFVKRGDLLAIYTTGAYGFAMSSNYNNRPRAAEVLVDGSEMKLIRRRETFEDLVRPEVEL